MNYKISKIRQFSAALFLVVFTIFLGLSISHAHHYNITISGYSSFSTEDHNDLKDPFLDSSLNCTIHTFSSSLKFDNIFSISEIIPEFNKALDNYYQLSNYSYPLNNLKQLRAPPIKLV